VDWFDLDLGAKPYKVLKYHEKGVRAVKFHQNYPLMATSSDDGNPLFLIFRNY
jgi:ribosome biogenesis protein ERB1